MKEIQKRIFPLIIALSALSVSGSAAFYSVTGLSKLFAGASLQVLVMASSLEIAKLVIASLLYQYWGELNKILRTYLSVAAFVLVLITSAGIYGFLSSAYQETAATAGIIDKEIELLELKKNRFEENRTYYLSEKEELDRSISDLRKGLANNVIQYKDKETGEIITTTSSSTRRALQKELDQAVVSRDNISQKLEVVTDSITSLEIQVLNVESNSEVASELGPLKYISELTNTPMSKVVNILMLVIIFVFDPLAISLVIAANFAFDRLKKKKSPEPVIEEPKNEVDEEIGHLMDLQGNQKYEEWVEEIASEVMADIIDENGYVIEDDNEVQEDIDRLKENLEKIEKIEKESKLEEEAEGDKLNEPQIKTLRYQPRDARNTRIDRI
jgi:hypothetical protein